LVRDLYGVPGPIKEFPSRKPIGAIILGWRSTIVAGTWMQLYGQLTRGSN